MPIVKLTYMVTTDSPAEVDRDAKSFAVVLGAHGRVTLQSNLTDSRRVEIPKVSDVETAVQGFSERLVTAKAKEAEAEAVKKQALENAKIRQEQRIAARKARMEAAAKRETAPVVADKKEPTK